MHENEIAEKAVEAAFKVHCWFGPGPLESAYEVCLVHELVDMGLSVETQIALPVIYRGMKLDAGYRSDIRLDRKVIVEVKVVEELHLVHCAAHHLLGANGEPTWSAHQLQKCAAHEWHPANCEQPNGDMNHTSAHADVAPTLRRSVVAV